MIEPWNNPILLPPPVLTVFSKNFNVSDMEVLQSCLNNTLRVLSMQSPLHQESALLSRFIYKFDKKFRSDIGFRNLKKVNICLKRYLSLNFLKDVKNFLTFLPKDEDMYLPTKQMLEYLLVRILTFSKLMLRICVTSKQGAIFYMHRVKRAESHWMSLMPYALLCRVWSLCKVLLDHACDWYNILYPFTEKFISKGLQFLPEGYDLPKDLREWIDISNLEFFGRLNWKNVKDYEMGELSEDNDESVDIFLDYVKKINESNENDIDDLNSQDNIDVRVPKNQNFVQSSRIVDCGKAISRDIFQKLSSQDSNSLKHTAESVTNKFSLERFIRMEDNFRNINSKQSLTLHLSFMQWQALMTALIKLKESIATNRKIERKFNQIWQEKCLAYI